MACDITSRKAVDALLAEEKRIASEKDPAKRMKALRESSNPQAQFLWAIFRDAFQEVDQQSLFKPITKKTLMLTQTARVPEMMREAFRTARSGRPGPVLVDLPRDVQDKEGDYRFLPPAPPERAVCSARALRT